MNDPESWLQRWRDGQIGFHEAEGSRHLPELWGALRPCKVLVPLCGKSRDLLWLAERGFAVTGVELSELAAEAFFAESGLAFDVRSDGGAGRRFVARDTALEFHVGNFFDFRGEGFEALFDRAAWIALPGDVRPHYVERCRQLLGPNPALLVVTVEYDQALCDGPPFSLSETEVRGAWPELALRSEREVIDDGPPKFKAAGVESLTERAWTAG